MSQSPYSAATYALLIYWAVGIALSVAVSDTEVGLIRDHPLIGRRLSGRVAPPMALTGFVLPFLFGFWPVRLPPTWILGSIPLMLPFIALSWKWSRMWIGRHSAYQRRRAGLITIAAGIGGLVPSSLLALYFLKPAWKGIVPITMFAAGITLPGSLSNLSIMAVTAGLPAEVPGGKVQGVAEIAAAGLVANLLVLMDLGMAWLGSGNTWAEGAKLLALGWGVGTIVIPGSILALRFYWRSMPDKLIMPAALIATLAGQWMGYLMVFRFPGLVPPVDWSIYP